MTFALNQQLVILPLAEQSIFETNLLPKAEKDSWQAFVISQTAQAKPADLSPKAQQILNASRLAQAELNQMLQGLRL